MDVKYYIATSVGAIVFVMAFEFLFHGVVLSGMYQATSEVWRPEGEHKTVFWIVSLILFSFIAVFFYTRNYEARGMEEGLRFGFYVGLVLASVKLADYCFLPIPGRLMAAWLIAEIMKGFGTGLVAALVYKPKRIEAV